MLVPKGSLFARIGYRPRGRRVVGVFSKTSRFLETSCRLDDISRYLMDRGEAGSTQPILRVPKRGQPPGFERHRWRTRARMKTTPSFHVKTTRKTRLEDPRTNIAISRTEIGRFVQEQEAGESGAKKPLSFSTSGHVRMSSRVIGAPSLHFIFRPLSLQVPKNPPSVQTPLAAKHHQAAQATWVENVRIWKPCVTAALQDELRGGSAVWRAVVEEW